MLLPRGMLEKERGTLQRWFDMIDRQGAGIKEEQWAKGSMKYFSTNDDRRRRRDGLRSKIKWIQKESREKRWS